MLIEAVILKDHFKYIWKPHRQMIQEKAGKGKKLVGEAEAKREKQMKGWVHENRMTLLEKEDLKS